jgi:4-hydroxy-tetrahydrodipicolinate synthase
MPQRQHDLAALRGSIPPLITPFVRGAVDYERYAQLIEFQIAEGSHGILVNGTTAEPSTLTTEERNKLVTLAIETAAGRVPVVAATGSQSLAESRVLTEHALSAGADALLIVTPYYIRPPQRGLVAYYLELAAGHDVPWMIYHIPGRTAVGVTLDTLKAVKDRSPHFVGIKQAVNDLGFVSECLHEFGHDFRVFVGLEELSFPMMTIGACGLMNAVGNLKPKVRRRSQDGPAPARAAARDQQSRVLRHEPDSDEIHDEKARPSGRQRAPPADGRRHAGARRQARRRARARRPVARHAPPELRGRRLRELRRRER